ncbi:MAG TPA: cyclic nucleotide-binding domain-containing protein [Longimicrobiales bacterium]|nr:cyclic nucleotide-binding domain-containing protein [Longimicrobiales bacterium]
MNWIEVAGYIASLLVFITFYMKTMVPLRLVAIGSNVAFITYGFFGGIYPVLILHLVLLPMNVWRLIEMKRLVRKVEQAAAGNLSLDWIRPWMKPLRCTADQILFRYGDPADRLFFVVSGQLKLDEIGRDIGPGSLFGEIGLFSPERKRTKTVRCVTDAELLWISETDLARLCYQNPAITFHLLRLITNRLIDDITRLETSRIRAGGAR